MIIPKNFGKIFMSYHLKLLGTYQAAFDFWKHRWHNWFIISWRRVSRIQKKLSSIVPLHARIEIGSFLNGPGKEECVEDFSEEEALSEGVAEERIDGNTKKGETDTAEQLPSLKKELSVLATAKWILSSRDGAKYATSRAIANVNALLGRDVTASSQQKLIKDYFTGDQSTRVLWSFFNWNHCINVTRSSSPPSSNDCETTVHPCKKHFGTTV